MKTKNENRRFNLSEKGRVRAMALLAIGTVSTREGRVTRNGEGLEERTGRQIDEAASKAGKKVQETQQSIGKQTGKAGEYLSDAAIFARIKTDLLNDSLLALVPVNVTTEGDVVTLSGTVDSQQAIDRAVAIARSHPNVTSVENRLVISVP
ncbi:BON domain-containing protein [Methylosarcina fibrata]|uniref:BON domain-containing protein n=1 Tax=Methylosarcina fibrata TaxID=105972 RepID=UPI0003701876|nr:BON domain-containing protein [Methylosarcina fibrata]